jgi:hypothetical protein
MPELRTGGSYEQIVAHIAREVRTMPAHTTVACLARGHKTLVQTATLLQSSGARYVYQKASNALTEPLARDIISMLQLVVDTHHMRVSEVNFSLSRLLGVRRLWNIGEADIWTMARAIHEAKSV